MLSHPIYDEAVSMLNEYEQSVERRARACLGSMWYYPLASPQTIREYVTAYDDTRRLYAMRTMLRDAIAFAHNMLQA